MKIHELPHSVKAISNWHLVWENNWFVAIERLDLIQIYVTPAWEVSRTAQIDVIHKWLILSRWLFHSYWYVIRPWEQRALRWAISEDCHSLPLLLVSEVFRTSEKTYEIMQVDATVTFWRPLILW